MFTNSTILNPLFWIVIGILNVLFVIGLRTLFHDLGIKVTKLKWFVLLCYWIILNLTIAGGFTLIGENETTAGLRFLGFFSIPILFAGAIIVKWILSGRIKQKV